LQPALERAWDGEWYRRGSFDDGTPLGSSQSEECRIDSIAQSWAVLSRAGDPARAARAMESVSRRLVRRDDRLALLFTPPFDKTPLDPGYIKGYPPGLRENGGQYSHAAMWAVFAFAELGQGDEACALFSLLNPINHARTPEEAAGYKVEPYVVAADVYSVPPHVGRGGWTWYTGAAGWMYRAGIEGILGLRLEDDLLRIDPCIPAAWPGFEATVQRGSTRYEIKVENPMAVSRGIAEGELDGVTLETDRETLRLPLDGGSHRLTLRMGNRAGCTRSAANPKVGSPAQNFETAKE
jgi:cyclic beta-1,2-glucan synthetase